jgi:hypothetical protein
MVSGKDVTTFVLFLVLLICFLLQVKQEVTKFIEGRTTETAEKMPDEDINLPHMTFCVKRPFKKEALLKLGITDIFFYTPHENPDIVFPDLNSTWNKVTYSKEDLGLWWSLHKSKYLYQYL